jgi:hypothetical protein
MGAILLGLMFMLFVVLALIWIAGAVLLGATALTEFWKFLGRGLEGTSLQQHPLDKSGH